VAAADLLTVLKALRDEFGFDMLVDLTAIDWAQGSSPRFTVVYHLFSMTRKEGPVVLRMRTPNRTDDVSLPSFTPIWRSAEFQEREAFDLYGIVFDGHPDLRRILMWEGFTDHPMRKDYVPPPDDDLEELRER